jgi:hypothetical protein
MTVFADTESSEDKEDHPMVVDQNALREWPRLFGLLLTDFITGWPYSMEIERDLSEQQQY